MFRSKSRRNVGNDHAVVIVKPLARGREQVVEDFLQSIGAKILDKEEVLTSAVMIGKHYEQFKTKPFYRNILTYWNGKVATVYYVELSNRDAARRMIGDAKITPGSFREYLTQGLPVDEVKSRTGVLDNGIHMSDSESEARREYGIWFEAPHIVRNILDPEYEDYVQSFYDRLYAAIRSSLRPGEYFQTMGSMLSGTHSPESATDVDFRVFLQNPATIRTRARDIVSSLRRQNFDAFVDKEDRDPESGAEYTKLEVNMDGGKADISIVPLQQYQTKLSGSSLSALLLTPEQAADIRAIKTKAKQDGVYKKVKEELNQIMRVEYTRWLKGEVTMPNFNFSLLRRNSLKYGGPHSSMSLDDQVTYFAGGLGANKQYELREVLADADYVSAYVGKALQKLQTKMCNAPTNMVISDIKNVPSILRKMKETNDKGELKYRNFRDLKDIARFAVLFDDRLENIGRKISDYADELERGLTIRNDKTVFLERKVYDDVSMAYFGPTHVFMSITASYGDLKFEIQLMPRSFWVRKEESHRLLELQRQGVPEQQLAGHMNRIFRKARLKPSQVRQERERDYRKKKEMRSRRYQQED